MVLTEEETQKKTTELYEQYHRLVRWNVSKFFRDKETQEDMVQEVFINVFRGLHTFNEDSSVKTWLHAVTRNACMNYIRSKSVRKHRMLNIVEPSDFRVMAIAAKGTDALKALQDKEIRKVIEESFEWLNSEKEVEALQMHYFGEMSIAEIAAYLGRTHQAVSHRLNRARKHLEPYFRRHLSHGLAV